MTQNTVFHWLKNNFLLSHQKLVFFTRFNLPIVTPRWPTVTLRWPIVRLNLVKNTNFEWGNNQIFLTQWKIVFWVTDHFCIKWTFKKNAIFCPKNAFFGQTCQFDPLCRPVPACSQGHNFRGVYFYLIPEGFIGGRWRRWWNHPLIIFNLARNGPFLEDLKKKVSKSD